MKKYLRICMVTMLCIGICFAPQKSQGAVPLAILEVIKAGVKKVIKAVDLKIQRLQNQTVWLQNAQKVLENALSKLKLEEISEWTMKQKEQYAKYFEELHKVKMLISYYQRITDITEKQARIVSEYQRAWSLVRQDKHFHASEIDYMAKVYSGILSETLKNIDQLSLVVNSFRTQMSDAKRLEIIGEVAVSVDENYTDLKTFNRENAMMSLQRAKGQHEIEFVRKLYGLENQ